MRNGLRSKWFGRVVIWIGAQNHDHPSRWAGIYIPKIGEIELHVTTDRIRHR